MTEHLDDMKKVPVPRELVDEVNRQRMTETCAHEKVSAVELVLTSEIVGHVCTYCLARLPAAWPGCDHEPVDASSISDPHETLICRRCGGRWTEGP